MLKVSRKYIEIGGSGRDFRILIFPKIKIANELRLEKSLHKEIFRKMKHQRYRLATFTLFSNNYISDLT